MPRSDDEERRPPRRSDGSSRRMKRSSSRSNRDRDGDRDRDRDRGRSRDRSRDRDRGRGESRGSSRRLRSGSSGGGSASGGEAESSRKPPRSASGKGRPTTPEDDGLRLVDGEQVRPGAVVDAGGWGDYEGQVLVKDEHTPHGRGVCTLSNGSAYNGDWRFGARHGHGVLVWPNGDKYYGGFRDDKKHGKGVWTWVQGHRYEGEFLADKKHGRGVFTFADGDKYDGDWLNDKQHGHGTQTWANGDKYDGEFREGKRNGHGTWVWADGRRITGTWVDGKTTGHAVLTWKNGARYEGDFVEGKQSGQGKKRWANGDQYQGGWLADKMDGQGVYVWENGDVYEGGWRDGLMHGRGAKSWKDGRVYEGEWQFDKMHGQGVYTWPDGEVYEGAFARDMRNGRGSYTYADGRTFDGEWKNDLKNGRGLLTWPNGNTYVGIMEDGYMGGRGVLTRSDGVVWDGNFHVDDFIEGAVTTPFGDRFGVDETGKVASGRYARRPWWEVLVYIIVAGVSVLDPLTDVIWVLQLWVQQEWAFALIGTTVVGASLLTIGFMVLDRGTILDMVLYLTGLSTLWEALHVAVLRRASPGTNIGGTNQATLFGPDLVCFMKQLASLTQSVPMTLLQLYVWSVAGPSEILLASLTMSGTSVVIGLILADVLSLGDRRTERSLAHDVLDAAREGTLAAHTREAGDKGPGKMAGAETKGEVVSLPGGGGGAGGMLLIAGTDAKAAPNEARIPDIRVMTGPLAAALQQQQETLRRRHLARRLHERIDAEFLRAETQTGGASYAPPRRPWRVPVIVVYRVLESCVRVLSLMIIATLVSPWIMLILLVLEYLALQAGFVADTAGIKHRHRVALKPPVQRRKSACIGWWSTGELIAAVSEGVCNWLIGAVYKAPYLSKVVFSYQTRQWMPNFRDDYAPTPAMYNISACFKVVTELVALQLLVLAATSTMMGELSFASQIDNLVTGVCMGCTNYTSDVLATGGADGDAWGEPSAYTGPKPQIQYWMVGHALVLMAAAVPLKHAFFVLYRGRVSTEVFARPGGTSGLKRVGTTVGMMGTGHGHRHSLAGGERGTDALDAAFGAAFPNVEKVVAAAATAAAAAAIAAVVNDQREVDRKPLTLAGSGAVGSWVGAGRSKSSMGMGSKRATGRASHPASKQAARAKSYFPSPGAASASTLGATGGAASLSSKSPALATRSAVAMDDAAAQRIASVSNLNLEPGAAPHLDKKKSKHNHKKKSKRDVVPET